MAYIKPRCSERPKNCGFFAAVGDGAGDDNQQDKGGDDRHADERPHDNWLEAFHGVVIDERVAAGGRREYYVVRQAD